MKIIFNKLILNKPYLRKKEVENIVNYSWVKPITNAQIKNKEKHSVIISKIPK